jgi:hypothetical protein
MHPFLNGLSAGASLVAGVLFLRFWRDTSDRLFLWFAFAFWMFALNWSALSLFRTADEARYLYFVPRLLGFVLILIAIVDKNRSPAER